MAHQENAIKVTLSTGRIVLLREMKIKYQNLATKLVGKKAEDNQLLMGTMMQQELLKILLINIDGKVPDQAQLMDLDSVFSYAEFSQLTKVVGKLMGGDEGESQTEIVITGKQSAG